MKLESVEVDERAGSQEKVETEDALGGEAVIHRSDLDLEIEHGDLAYGKPADTLGKDELDSPNASDTLQGV
ncbi:MAG TPA: hypothetical protein VOA80_05350 [Thermoanaerobaculia bacterium]|nr:hypothetical protein [Thermoanaerobaculia bacterium]